MNSATTREKTALRTEIIHRLAGSYMKPDRSGIDWKAAFAENPTLTAELQIEHTGPQPLYAIVSALKKKGLWPPAETAQNTPATAFNARAVKRGNLGNRPAGAEDLPLTAQAIRYCPICGQDVYDRCAKCGTGLVGFLLTANFKVAENG